LLGTLSIESIVWEIPIGALSVFSTARSWPQGG
jgi:hypothetical protein